jgi:hypothetical protein
MFQCYAWGDALTPPVQDLINMLRITGIGEHGAALDIKERMMEAHIRSVKMSLTRAERNAQVARRALGETDDSEHSITAAISTAVEEIRALFGPGLIRRHTLSLDNEGKPIVGRLPPYQQHIVFLNLTTVERARLEELRANDEQANP